MSTTSRIKENMLKNGIVFLIAIILYPSISTSLGKINSDQTNDFLLIISVLFVAVCFANFAFTRMHHSDIQNSLPILSRFNFLVFNFIVFWNISI